MPKRRKPGRRADATGRSKIGPRFVMLHFWLLDCEAYQALTPYARALLVEFYKVYNGSNNGELFLSVRDAAERMGASKNAAHAAVKQLGVVGFIKPNVQGAFHVKQRHATTWILTEFPFNGELASKDFMKWAPTAKKKNTVPSQGQPVTPQGQKAKKPPRKAPICHSTGTDNGKAEPSRSLSGDTYSTMQGGSPADEQLDLVTFLDEHFK